MKKVPVTTTYLEMRECPPSPTDEANFDLVRIEIPTPDLNRFLYASVGADWSWYERLPWTQSQWLTYLEGDVETWIAYVRGAPAGYFELERQDGGDVEIAYFGLVPAFIGHGHGRALLAQSIARAWSIEGTQRVWLHTCTLDHPQALPNYLAAGFEIYKVEDTVEDVGLDPFGSRCHT